MCVGLSQGVNYKSSECDAYYNIQTHRDADIEL
jgi:hypothetical protein